MLNFRKLKKDFSPAILKEGRDFFDKKMVLSTKIVNLSAQSVRLSCQVVGNYDNTYESEIEIDRQDSTIIDSDCDCSYKYDCQHLAAVIFYLEGYLDKLVVAYSKETGLDKSQEIDAEEKATLQKTFKEAESKEEARREKKQQKELVEEYINASEVLGKSPFFLPEEHVPHDKAALLVIFSDEPEQGPKDRKRPEIQLALRLPYRSKPLNVPNIKEFLNAIRYNEMLYIGTKRFYFSLSSFSGVDESTIKLLMDHARFPESKGGSNPRVAQIGAEAFGTILAQAHEQAVESAAAPAVGSGAEVEHRTMPGLFCGSLENPLRFSNSYAFLRIELEYLEQPAAKILLNPTIVIEDKILTLLEEARLFECAMPGMIYDNTYYRFEPHIRRRHLRNLFPIRDITIPEPLFGSFVENSLPELMRFAEVANQEIIENFVTLPYAGSLEAECDIHYLDGELEASLHFIYDTIKVPAVHARLNPENIEAFVTPQGILARNLTQERKIIDELFLDFVFDSTQGVYVAKSEKKIVEFMTEIIPQNQGLVNFNCPENLLDQFLYDDTHFILKLKETKRVDVYEIDVTVEGHLNGVTVDLLWECLASKRAFIELAKKKSTQKSRLGMNKILVLDLEKLAPVVQIFDEIGLNRLDNHKEERSLWSLASIDLSQCKGLPIEISMSKKLREIQQQMIGAEPQIPKSIPKDVKAVLRNYQKEGVGWLERLRGMHLNGILADDMGLGKTLQAIISLTQCKLDHPKAVSMVVCPTSLVYNWVEEFIKFNPKINVLPVDGTPTQRKKLLKDAKKYDVIITSYSLLQKDIELYQKMNFAYAILDEAQHIKNRSTRNAKSVKMLNCAHRLILTGTPIENSLEELWSLFDFLMPGLLSSYDRFVEKYIRGPSQGDKKSLVTLRKKLFPFILRRMKKDVLKELPPVSDIIYRCHLSEQQKSLYRSYAESAREELSKLVKKEGFDKVQIHVLATLTRLKQICCHPAIFAKENPEPGDSAKYDMLMELLQTLMEGKHRTVIFSQYTRMLQIMRKDFRSRGIRFEYLDGSTKNRVSLVNKFNKDANIPVFLVSLKAGGSGLNLVGADTVIHYDMWWNPAVESQATDRVHRIGQKNSVSSYKLVNVGTIEEKILELQDRKRGLVKKIINTDEEAISKLTWEEVLELLQT
ncbi:MAG: SNF2-related protein [Waddliaceae bacterium]